MFSTCIRLLLSTLTVPVFTLPNPSVSCGPNVLCCHSLPPMVYTHTPALACSTCLAISHASFSHNLPCTLLRPLLSHLLDGCFLVDGEYSSQTDQTIFCPTPPPGETGAMVSSTLKLGISILNGGNADVQQVTERTREEDQKRWEVPA